MVMTFKVFSPCPSVNVIPSLAGLFSGAKFPEVSVWRADGRSDLFSSQTLCELKWFAGDRRFFELVGQTGGQTPLHVYLRHFLFPHISCQRQLKESSPVLFTDPVSLGSLWINS